MFDFTLRPTMVLMMTVECYQSPAVPFVGWSGNCPSYTPPPPPPPPAVGIQLNDGLGANANQTWAIFDKAVTKTGIPAWTIDKGASHGTLTNLTQDAGLLWICSWSQTTVDSTWTVTIPANDARVKAADGSMVKAGTFPVLSG